MIVRLTRTWLLALAAAIVCALPALAAPSDEPPTAEMKKLIEAMKVKSYDAFMSDADATMRAKLTREIFDGIAGMLSPRLQQGYKTGYLGKLRQHEFETFLWKVEFTDGGDDALVKVFIKERKVGGFWIQ